ncbi:FAD-dependent oxidoreductase [Neomoorella thermoacetica]|uniref:FAD-dependent oxidoreductase n=1 Tax=Neomoorella thermoacetica TaxID=1525 RepID=UPI0008FB6023|nr:FAD-dependent oxidoreductase [Moorella thermoacetica]OIQ54354.1 tRNA 5-methylaminomethyl-2-thiouridine biosynthesis bifunctional protein MnmC [Moorella thermoacetica]
MKKDALPVAVLGAGIAGVQAALDLSRLGYQVVLLERSSRPGGKLTALPKTFPTNDCSACVLSPPDSFFCIRSPHFIKQGSDNITLLTGVEVKKLTRNPRNFSLHFYREGREEELNATALILCPGYEEYLPANLDARYGYGRYPGVLTGLELEQRLGAEGYLCRPGDNGPLQQVAFIQCAGSRDPAGGMAYCSAVCCMYALKEALMLYEGAAARKFPLPEITLFYMDLRTYGRAYESYLAKARQEYGLKLVRSRIHSIIQLPGNPRLTIRYAPEEGPARVAEFDLAVLATGLRPPDGARDLAAALGIELDTHGFCQTSPLAPVSTPQPGIFVAGAFSGPCDVIDAVTQGSAAATACAAWLKENGAGPVKSPLLPPSSGAVDPSPRTGVFICGCDHLAANLDLKGLEEYCRSLPGVDTVRELSLCDPQAGEEFLRAINENGLGRVVVAACSARALEPVLKARLDQAGLPGVGLKIVNILDHAARIYSGRVEMATRKAGDLVRMAIAGIKATAPYMNDAITVAPATLVIGGGAAGMTTALHLGDLGYEVHLVEKESQLGGNLLRIQRTLRGADVQAWLAGQIRRLMQHPRIHVHLDARILDTSGKPGSFQTEIEIAGERRESITHGVTILATGAGEKKTQQYLYGQHPAVVTALELEDLLKTRSPRLAGAQRVVFIQCVESRDAGHPYCSRTCCSETLKNALELKKINPAAAIYVLNRDIMAYGLQEQWYEAARSRGVVFLHYQPGEPPRVTPLAAGTGPEGKLLVRAYDAILEEEVTIEADLLVLATGMEPPAENRRLATLFRVPLDERGFFATSHPKLKPVETPVPGIYTCGLAAGPGNLEEALASAQAAAGKAAADLARERYELHRQVARVEGACAACLTCVRVCPHGAPAIKDHRSHIAPLLCQGCGACVAACPARAITLTGYSHTEIEAELQALSPEAGKVQSIVIFTCSYCAYANSENAGSTSCPDDVSILQVPCLSRVGTLEVLRAIEAGARQIVLTGCVAGQCHFRPARAFGSQGPGPDPMLCQEQAWRRARKILGELGFDENTVKVLRLPPPTPGRGQPLI